MRVIFSTIFLLYLLENASHTQQIFEEPLSVCIHDLNFDLTSPLNAFFAEYNYLKNIYTIYAAFLMDFMIVTFLVFFSIYWRTTRIICTMAFFYPFRASIQQIFFMGRISGWLFSYPGIHSITINYFDTNDFYFSGHVGSAMIFTLEYYASGWRRMSCFVFLIVANEWLFLSTVRIHYIIDLLAGVAVAIILHEFGEKLAFYPDV